MILYRPVGLEEFRLIYEKKMLEFPPRLLEQPIFYPVLSLEYACQIACNWNTKFGNYAGYVTKFEVIEEYVLKFPSRQVGTSKHMELWVPAEDLDEFNRHIVGNIQLVNAYFGESFKGYITNKFNLKNKDVIEQFVTVKGMFEYSLMDFHGEITANHVAVFLNYPYWQQHDFARVGIEYTNRNLILNEIQKVWVKAFPEIILGC